MGMQLKISDYRRIFYWYASLFLFMGKYLILSHISLGHFERKLVQDLKSALPLYWIQIKQQRAVSPTLCLVTWTREYRRSQNKSIVDAAVYN